MCLYCNAGGFGGVHMSCLYIVCGMASVVRLEIGVFLFGGRE